LKKDKIETVFQISLLVSRGWILCSVDNLWRKPGVYRLVFDVNTWGSENCRKVNGFTLEEAFYKEYPDPPDEVDKEYKCKLFLTGLLNSYPLKNPPKVAAIVFIESTEQWVFYGCDPSQERACKYYAASIEVDLGIGPFEKICEQSTDFKLGEDHHLLFQAYLEFRGSSYPLYVSNHHER